MESMEKKHMKSYTTIVGMEIHVELATASKMFCGCQNDPFYAKKPNSYTCPVCLGMPGGLPVPNRKAIEWTIRLGIALGCEIQKFSKFDRKHYFYPDLAKGYQISQFDLPFCKNGNIETTDGPVRINRVHLEEDTGKLQHTTVDGKKVTLIDFNRSGVPLVEIVTEPDIHSGNQAKEFLKKLQQIIRYLEISTADMEKGSMRLEPNISVAACDENGVYSLPSYKVEVKNINSFNFVKRAIDFETARHKELLEKGETPKQETRGYVESSSSTISQRSKENAIDYRYFPEPDIPPMRFTDIQIEELTKTIPELPDEKVKRFGNEYGILSDIAWGIVETKDQADFFEACVSLAQSSDLYKDIQPITLANILINKKILIGEIAPKQVLEQIHEASEAKHVPSEELAQVVQKVIQEQTKAVLEYKAGKTTAIMYLLGQVKRALNGKGDPKNIEQELLKHLS